MGGGPLERNEAPQATPYWLLQLQPDAPRALVEEAYWALVALARGEGARDSVVVRRLSELNDAYSAVAHREDPAVQAQNGNVGKGSGARRTGLLGRRSPEPVTHRPQNLYEQLHVAPHADPAIIRLAAAMLLQEQARTKEQMERRAAIERARDVLTDDEQRGRYDEAQGIERTAPTFAASARDSSATQASGAGATRWVDAVVVEQAPKRAKKNRRAAKGRPAIAPLASLKGRAARVRAGGSNGKATATPGTAMPPGHAADAAIDALAASVAVPSERSAPMASEHPGAPVDAEAQTTPLDEEARVPAASTNGAAPAEPQEEREESEERASPPRKWSLPPLFRRDDADLTDGVEEAENQRVLALREALGSEPAAAPADVGVDDSVAPAERARVNGDMPLDRGDPDVEADIEPSRSDVILDSPVAVANEVEEPAVDASGSESDDTPSAAAEGSREDGAGSEGSAHDIEPDAVLRFTSGPRKGARIAITRDAIILGATPSADVMLPLRQMPGGVPRIRIWKQAESYLLQQLDGPLVLIGGRPIDMPIVVLDDGDEIAIGDNTVRFERMSLPDPAIVRLPSAR